MLYELVCLVLCGVMIMEFYKKKRKGLQLEWNRSFETTVVGCWWIQFQTLSESGNDNSNIILRPYAVPNIQNEITLLLLQSILIRNLILFFARKKILLVIFPKHNNRKIQEQTNEQTNKQKEKTNPYSLRKCQ